MMPTDSLWSVSFFLKKFCNNFITSSSVKLSSFGHTDPKTRSIHDIQAFIQKVHLFQRFSKHTVVSLSFSNHLFNLPMILTDPTLLCKQLPSWIHGSFLVGWRVVEFSWSIWWKCSSSSAQFFPGPGLLAKLKVSGTATADFKATMLEWATLTRTLLVGIAHICDPSEDPKLLQKKQISNDTWSPRAKLDLCAAVECAWDPCHPLAGSPPANVDSTYILKKYRRFTQNAWLSELIDLLHLIAKASWEFCWPFTIGNGD